MLWKANLGVLVGRDSSEGGLWERESLEHTPSHAVEVIGLHDVEAGMVAMHGMQDDLRHRGEKISLFTAPFILCIHF